MKKEALKTISLSLSHIIYKIMIYTEIRNNLKDDFFIDDILPTDEIIHLDGTIDNYGWNIIEIPEDAILIPKKYINNKKEYINKEINKLTKHLNNSINIYKNKYI